MNIRSEARRAVKFVIAVLLLGVRLWAAPPGAGQEFQPIVPSELQMTSEPLAPGAPAIILERRVDRDDREGRDFENIYLRIKILTEEGRKYANVELPYYSGIESISNLKARTIRPDGSVADFGGTIYEKSLVKGRNLKVQVKTFTFPDVQVGSILEYFYTKHLTGIYDSHWDLNSDLFTKRAEFSLRPYASYSGGMRLHWIWKGLPAGVQPREESGHLIRMEINNMAAFQEEAFMPPESGLRASVDFIYPGPFRGDAAKYWKEIGKNWNDALEFFLKKHKAVDEAAAQMVSPADSAEEKLREIYSRVQSLRNTSYEAHRTEEEDRRSKEKLADNVDEIWKHGYGNAVELAWLFLGLARAAGFDAHGCWVASRSERFFNPNLMQAEELNANIVLVKTKDKDFYLDPGMPFVPFGLLPWYETATPGLRLDRSFDFHYQKATFPKVGGRPASSCWSLEAWKGK